MVNRRRDDGDDELSASERYDNLARERHDRRQAFKRDFAADYVEDRAEMRKLLKEAFKEWLTELIDGALSGGMRMVLKMVGYILIGTIIVVVLWALGWKPPVPPSSVPPLPPIQIK